MTNTGYGDITPKRIGETFVAMTMQLAGVTMIALLVGSISEIVTQVRWVLVVTLLSPGTMRPAAQAAGPVDAGRPAAAAAASVVAPNDAPWPVKDPWAA